MKLLLLLLACTVACGGPEALLAPGRYNVHLKHTETLGWFPDNVEFDATWTLSYKGREATLSMEDGTILHGKPLDGRLELTFSEVLNEDCYMRSQLWLTLYPLEDGGAFNGEAKQLFTYLTQCDNEESLAGIWDRYDVEGHQ